MLVVLVIFTIFMSTFLIMYSLNIAGRNKEIADIQINFVLSPLGEKNG